MGGYIDFVKEALGTLGTIRSRKMFGGYCLYWEAQKPDCNTPPNWSGNFQARLSGIAGGGDKTINFSIDCPTAVGVSSFGASMALPALAVVLPVGVGGAGLLVWRARRRKRQ